MALGKEKQQMRKNYRDASVNAKLIQPTETPRYRLSNHLSNQVHMPNYKKTSSPPETVAKELKNAASSKKNNDHTRRVGG